MDEVDIILGVDLVAALFLVGVCLLFALVDKR